MGIKKPLTEAMNEPSGAASLTSEKKASADPVSKRLAYLAETDPSPVCLELNPHRGFAPSLILNSYRLSDPSLNQLS